MDNWARWNFEKILYRIEDQIFDWRLGIRTTGSKDLHELDIRDEAIVHGRQYQGTPVRVLKKCFAELKQDFSEYTFIDYGCGLGRTMAFAGMANFKKLIGIEFAADLCEKALFNLDSLAEKGKLKTGRYEVICRDASKFIPEEGPCVHFFYNPFNNIVLREVLENLMSSPHFSNRDLFIYVNPRREFLFNLLGLETVLEIPNWNINRQVHIYRKNGE